MKPLLLFLRLLTICFCVTNSVLAQDPILDTLKQRFEDYQRKTPQEKVYLHLNRTFLLTGEILWFKAYAVNADGKHAAPSKVVYVEILDQNNLAVLQGKVALYNGNGQGSFFLNASLQSGNYNVRAYTNWMKNFSSDFYFRQTITVVNPFVNAVLDKVGSDNDVTVGFFPEGGNLVAGQKSKIGFRITDLSGKCRSCSGVVTDNNNTKVADILTFKNGIGFFYLTPQINQHYTANIVCNGRSSVHKLPEAYSQGIAMRVTDSVENINIKVSRTKEFPSSKLYVITHSQQVIRSAAVLNMRHDSAQIFVQKSKLPDGISIITVFNEDLQPVCERLYFKYPTKELHIGTIQDAQQYDIRELVTLDISTNVNMKLTAANLSVSVHKVDSIPEQHREGIREFVLLISDLPGTFDSLDYYFSNDAYAREAMDQLMITQGWRRFNWKKIIEREQTKILHLIEFRGQMLKGKVVDANGTPVKSANIFLSAPDKTIRLYSATSNKNGEILLETKELEGAQTFVVRATKKDTTFNVSFESPFSPDREAHKLQPFHLQSTIANQLLKRSLAMQLQDVYHEDKRDRSKRTFGDTLAFYGQPDVTYRLDDYTRFPKMEEVMREYVTGVNVRKRDGKFAFIVLDKQHNRYFKDDPLILLDGVPLVEPDDIMNVDPRKIKKVDVLNRKFFLGETVIEGLVSYSTYNGDLAGIQLNPKLVTIDFEGLQMLREFYSPDHSAKSETKRIPDQRNQLYWNPSVSTNQAGLAQVKFYTSDLRGRFVIDIEGISSDGVPGGAKYYFSVE